MKATKISIIYPALILFSSILFLSSCSKEYSVPLAASGTVASSQIIGVGISATTTDSIYVVGACAPEDHLDSLAVSGLPASVTSYLTSNYGGYSFQKGFAEKDSSGNITGYVVIINYKNNPVGLKFDASGNFVRVLEQRDRQDLTGKGYHEGGCFGNRDGLHRDTVSLAKLPAAILSYFTTNYPKDTLVRAYLNNNGSYIVFTVDSSAYATVFTSNGTFVSRTQLHNDGDRGNVSVIQQSALLPAIQTYLTTTYPNYVFDQAFSFSQNGSLLGYIVAIDANNTKYAVQFDASGKFIGAITIW
jgi:hypothetical protein